MESGGLTGAWIGDWAKKPQPQPQTAARRSLSSLVQKLLGPLGIIPAEDSRRRLLAPNDEELPTPKRHAAPLISSFFTFTCNVGTWNGADTLTLNPAPCPLYHVPCTMYSVPCLSGGSSRRRLPRPQQRRTLTPSVLKGAQGRGVTLSPVRCSHTMYPLPCPVYPAPCTLYGILSAGDSSRRRLLAHNDDVLATPAPQP